MFLIIEYKYSICIYVFDIDKILNSYGSVVWIITELKVFFISLKDRIRNN